MAQESFEVKNTTTTSASARIKKKPFDSKQLKRKLCFSAFVIAWAIITTLAAQYIVALPMVMILGRSMQEPGWMLVYYILVYAITLALVLLIPPKTLKIYRAHRQKAKTKQSEALVKDLQVTPKEMGVYKLPTFVDIGLAPVGYVVYAVLASILTTLMTAFVWFNADEAQNVGFQEYLSGMDQIFAMISIVFIAPIAEEIVMRGWLYGKLRRKWSFGIAAVITSLTFAVMHGQWNVGVSVFALSLVLCTLREITGTIWSGMLLHMLSNGIAFYILYIIT